MPLTNTAVSNAKAREKQYRITDGQGMYLLIKPSGKRYWRLDYILHGKRKTFAIGKYPEKSLAQARTDRDKAKSLVADGIDPVQHRQATKGQRKEAAANSFEAVSSGWFALQCQTWTEGHASTVNSRLKRDILPWLGPRPIEGITAPEILKVLRRIESRGAGETAHRNDGEASPTRLQQKGCSYSRTPRANSPISYFSSKRKSSIRSTG